MRILLASIGHFADSPGGVERFVQDEATALLERGHEVWALAPGKATLPEHEIRDGIHLLRYVPEKVAPWNPSRSVGHQRAVRGVLSRHLPQVDAVHGHVLLSFLGATDFYGPSVLRVFDVHSVTRMEMAITWKQSGYLRRLTAPFGLPILNRMERQCLDRSERIFTKSQFTVDCITRTHGRETGRRLRVIPGWADAHRYVPIADRAKAKSALGWPTDSLVLFTLRRLVPRMGLPLLLEAAHILQSDGVDFHLFIGGDGSQRSALESQAAKLGLGSRVRFLGRVDDEQLPLLYGACDAFVLPTAELEGFGIIAVEALLAGRPVLATPVGAIPELLRKFEPRWLAESTAPQDIATLLGRYAMGELPVHSSEELHSIAQHHYGRDHILPAYVKEVFGNETSPR